MATLVPTDEDPFAAPVTAAPASGATATPVDFDPFADQTPPPPQGLWDSAKAAYNQRMQNTQNYQSQVDAGKLNPAAGEIGKIGQAGALAFSDPITGLAKAGYNALPDSAQGAIKRTADGFTSGVKDEMQDLGAAEHYYLGDNAIPDNTAGIGAALDKGQKYYNSSPNLKAVTEGGANILGAAPGAGMAEGLAEKGLAGVVNAGKTVASVPGKIGSGISTALTPVEQHAQNFWQNRTTPEQAKQVAGIKYDEAENIGGSLTSDKRNQFIDAAHGAEKGADGNIVPPSPLAQKILDNLNKTRDQPLTLKGAQNIEQDINQNISYQPNGMLTPDSVQLLKIKSALRNTINSASPQDLIGGPQAWQSWNDAKKAYSGAGILTDINNMINKATFADQPAAQLKRNLAKWSNKSSTISGLDPDEMDLVKGAIKTDFANEIMRSGSSRLIPIGATALGLGNGHGIMGAMAGTATSMAGRNAGFAYQLGKMGDLADAIGERMPDMTKVPQKTPAAQLQLTKPVWSGAQNHPGFSGPVTGNVTPPPPTAFQAASQAAKDAAAQKATEAAVASPEKIFTGRRGESFVGRDDLPETTASLAARIGEDPRQLVQQYHGATPEQFENATPAQKEALVDIAQRNRAAQTTSGPVLNVGENPDQFGETPKGPMQRPDMPNKYQPTQNEVNASGNTKPYSQTATGTSQRPFQGETPNPNEAAAQSQYGSAKAQHEDELNQRWQQYKSSSEYQNSDAARERQAQSDKYTGKDAPKTSAFAQKTDNTGRYAVDENGFVKSAAGGPIIFKNQKDAGNWILKTGNKSSPDQIFDLHNHPSGKGFTVKQTGTAQPKEPPPFKPSADPNKPPPNPNARHEQPEYNANSPSENKGNLLGQKRGGSIKGQIAFKLNKNKK